MREYIDVLRRLWRLERVTFEGEVVRVKDLELDLAHAADLAHRVSQAPKPIHIPVYIGASRERMLDLAADIADGVLLNSGTPIEYVRTASRRVRERARARGRDPETIAIPKMLMVALTNNRDEPWKAVKRKVTAYLGQQEHIQESSGLDSGQIDAITAALGGWPPNPGGLEKAAQLLSDNAARQFAVVGSTTECREQIDAFLDAGATYPILKTEFDDLEDVLHAFAPVHQTTERRP
jgi:5,10-methylenetetrahydromethanopterin reductase